MLVKGATAHIEYLQLNFLFEFNSEFIPYDVTLNKLESCYGVGNFTNESRLGTYDHGMLSAAVHSDNIANTPLRLQNIGCVSGNVITHF